MTIRGERISEVAMTLDGAEMTGVELISAGERTFEEGSWGVEST
jgi:hypothetical protein